MEFRRVLSRSQWFELRRHVPRAGWWIAASALAWAVGLTALGVVAFPLWQPGQGTALVVAIGLLGGLAMAASMSLTTGLALLRLLRGPRTRPTDHPHPAKHRVGIECVITC